MATTRASPIATASPSHRYRQHLAGGIYHLIAAASVSLVEFITRKMRAIAKGLPPASRWWNLSPIATASVSLVEFITRKMRAIAKGKDTDDSKEERYGR